MEIFPVWFCWVFLPCFLAPTCSCISKAQLVIFNFPFRKLLSLYKNQRMQQIWGTKIVWTYLLVLKCIYISASDSTPLIFMITWHWLPKQATMTYLIHSSVPYVTGTGPRANWYLSNVLIEWIILDGIKECFKDKEESCTQQSWGWISQVFNPCLQIELFSF